MLIQGKQNEPTIKIALYVVAAHIEAVSKKVLPV